MSTHSIESERDLEGIIRVLQSRPRPFTVNVTKGKHRSDRQNNLQMEIINQIAGQRDDMTFEEWRGYCKLRIGVPILRAENEAFREAYDKHFKPLQYESKIAMMIEPLNWPVTRLMTTKQFTRYIDDIERHFAEQGVVFKELER